MRKLQGAALKMADEVVIFRGVNFHDAHSLYMRNLVESMPRRLEDKISRQESPTN
jgi:hypothetical protein